MASRLEWRVWSGGELCLGAIVGALPGMRGVFRFERLLVLETGERAFDVSRHGHVAGAGIIIPFERQTTIAAASPVKADFVGEFESGDQVLGIIAIGVANAEVVDYGLKSMLRVSCVQRPGVSSQGV